MRKKSPRSPEEHSGEGKGTVSCQQRERENVKNDRRRRRRGEWTVEGRWSQEWEARRKYCRVRRRWKRLEELQKSRKRKRKGTRREGENGMLREKQESRREWTDGIPPLPSPLSSPSPLRVSPLLRLAARLLFTGPASQASLPLSLTTRPTPRRAASAVPPLGRVRVVVLVSWVRERCSVESSRNASDSTRLQLRALPTVFLLLEGTAAAFPDARASAIRVDQRRDAPRLEYATHSTHSRRSSSRRHRRRYTLALLLHYIGAIAVAPPSLFPLLSVLATWNRITLISQRSFFYLARPPLCIPIAKRRTLFTLDHAASMQGRARSVELSGDAPRAYLLAR